jgi:hypothetical protein
MSWLCLCECEVVLAQSWFRHHARVERDMELLVNGRKLIGAFGEDALELTLKRTVIGQKFFVSPIRSAFGLASPPREYWSLSKERAPSRSEELSRAAARSARQSSPIASATKRRVTREECRRSQQWFSASARQQKKRRPILLRFDRV